MSLQIDNIQTKHLGKAFYLHKTISQRAKKKQPVDQLKNKLDDLLKSSSQVTLNNRLKFQNIRLQDELPISEKAETIKSLLQQNQVIIVAGETGCGKTTQLPKICFQAGFGARGLIAHTQPRRVAATSVAKRIADEVNSPLGELIGYSIRFNNKTSQSTRLKIMTDGVLLTELESDPLLSQYEVIIIDEAHERSLNIDFLLGFLKQVLAKRKELKLIITSATIDPERFSKNFNNAPIISVEGRTFPVEVRYRPLEENEQDNSTEQLLNGISLAVDECISESSGDILIFADGEGQIKSIVKHLSHRQLTDSVILPLYARLSISEQQKIFAKNNKRKIIISTNVAETSLTVPGIVFVVDTGTARVSRFSQRNKIQQLPIEKISRASADQRKGRCGRIAAGICIRLYSEEDYLLRDEFTCAEIKRTNLSSVALRLKAMEVKNVESFPFLEPPDERAWNVAFNSLFELGAINKTQEINKIGLLMSKLPVDPQLARILVQPELVAVNEMLIICSLMSVREVRERPHDKQQKADQAHKAYIKGYSDILTVISLWQQLEQKKKELSSNGFKQWCSSNFINFLGWLEWRKVYFQLKESVENLGVKVNQSQAHDDDIHQGLIPGFIAHIFCKTQEKYYQGVRGLKVWLHPSSLSFKKNTAWLLSAEMIETEKLYARMNCQIEPQWIEKFATHLLKSNYLDIHWRKKNGQVMAYLNQTLLGLPVVNRQLVNYSTVEHEKCRNIFLKEGLASDQLNDEYPFIKANRQKLAALQEQEKRQRLNNISIDIESLAALYQSVLPDHICSGISLKRWLKKDFKKRNQLLTFTLEALTQNEAGEVDAYPSQILIKGVNLNLSYCFAPGTPADGVSVEIPENMLSQFNDRDFDWLVPGYLEDKVLSTLKSLPKIIRRDLIPLNETAKDCSDQLARLDQVGKSFTKELARELQKQCGKRIHESDFDMEKVASHLTMKYSAVGKGKVQPLLSLANISSKKQKVFNKESLSTVDKYFEWKFDCFHVEKQLTIKQHVSRVFQGLKDCYDHVTIEEFPSLECAIDNHKKGIARLVVLNNITLVNQVFNSWPEKKLLERLSIRFNGFRAVYDSLVLKWAVSLISKNNSKRITAFTNDEFTQLSQLFSTEFRAQVSQQLIALLPLIKQREDVFFAISGLSQNAYPESIEDMKEQLKQLWTHNNIISCQSDALTDYTRFQQGLTARIKRIQANYPKEQVAMETWLEWESWWNELVSTNKKLDLLPRLNELYWILQEFRISLFSPGVKVKGSVSAKKLQKLFEQIEIQLSL